MGYVANCQPEQDTLKLPYVDVFRHSRTGIEYAYYRRGGKRLRINAAMGSADFFGQLAEIESAFEGDAAEPLVYFIRAAGRVKVGWTRNLKQRLTTLQTSTPERLHVFYATPGGRELEQTLHKAFAEHRMTGEWFKWSPEIGDWIRSDKDRRMEGARR